MTCPGSATSDLPEDANQRGSGFTHGGSAQPRREPAGKDANGGWFARRVRGRGKDGEGLSQKRKSAGNECEKRTIRESFFYRIRCVLQLERKSL